MRSIVKIFFLTTLTSIALVLSSCVSAPKNEKPTVIQLKKQEIIAIDEHTKHIESYQEWLNETNKLLENQYRELQELISKVKSKKAQSVIEVDLQYRLIGNMNDTAIITIQLQNKTQKDDQQYSTMRNILKSKHDAEQDVVRNIK